ncbi:hypothetical protein HETIRDRAFT_118597 [Heterobasidion irregulare TC 32-1]|uniref:Uncharacterized protein n=1 Tax=Heterobasidion irregulare (strain TC 32-1) TaxID=747525 RepID=W4JUA5_HETIT|nr:uncharacterized protein HETIRDRAFT_118597 [Heterobasidion irregulare TC 32-1]ETW77132.1 hypothetical protein HETIRDRAFT_118597 [Heterobasidion irregulare TC 32-1]
MSTESNDVSFETVLAELHHLLLGIPPESNLPFVENSQDSHYACFLNFSLDPDLMEKIEDEVGVFSEQFKNSSESQYPVSGMRPGTVHLPPSESVEFERSFLGVMIMMVIEKGYIAWFQLVQTMIDEHIGAGNSNDSSRGGLALKDVWLYRGPSSGLRPQQQ